MPLSEAAEGGVDEGGGIRGGPGAGAGLRLLPEDAGLSIAAGDGKGRAER